VKIKDRFFFSIIRRLDSHLAFSVGFLLRRFCDKFPSAEPSGVTR